MKARKNKKESLINYVRLFFLTLTGLVVAAGSSTRSFAQTENAATQSTSRSELQIEKPEQSLNLSPSDTPTKRGGSKAKRKPLIVSTSTGQPGLMAETPTGRSCKRESDCGQFSICITKKNKGQCVELYAISSQNTLTKPNDSSEYKNGNALGAAAIIGVTVVGAVMMVPFAMYLVDIPLGILF